MKDKFIMGLILVLMATGVFFYVDYKPNRISPVAHQGVLNANKWSFSKQGVLPLVGEWAYYPAQLLQPQEIGANQVEESFVHILNSKLSWNWKPVRNSWGYGTYRLTINIPPSDSTMGLLIGNIGSSSRIFVNGKLVRQSGVPGVSPSTYTPSVRPQVVYFHPSHGTISLVIQVANFDFYRTGIISPIVLGTGQQISRMSFINSGMDYSAMSVIGLFGVYYFFLFIMLKKNRNQQFDPLLLVGVFFLVFAAEIPFEGAEVIFRIFPNIPYPLYWKLKIILPTMMIVPVIQYLLSVAVAWWLRRIFSVLRGVFVSYGFATLVLPVHVMAQGIVIHSLMGVGVITIVGVFATLLIAYGRGRYGPFEQGEIRLYILAVLSLIVIDLNNVFYLNSLVDNNVITNIARVIFAGLILVLLAFRYYHAYSRMELVTEKLQRMDRLKDDFLIQTAHELKTPLHGIINLLQPLLDAQHAGRTTQASLPQTQQLRLVQVTARRMSKTVNDIMDLARIREGRLSVRLTDVDLRSCFAMVVELFSYQIKDKDLRIVYQIHDGAESVRADESRLIQVLSNLIHNSTKHTVEGLIRIVAESRRGFIEISVEDTGLGISADEQGALFTPYERKDVDTLTDDTGIGLGLFISRELARVMGGELYLDWSERDKGSRFTCRFPKTHEETAATVSDSMQCGVENTTDEIPVSGAWQEVGYPPEAGQPSKDRPIILAVDDEFVNLKVLSSLFNNQDYNVLTASSGRDALRQISQYKPELVLLDVMLPDISGYEVCRLLRRTHSMIDLPVLFLTVRNTPDDVEYALAVGGNDFVVKPFESREIRARVETLLTMKKLSQAVVKNEIAFLHAQIKPHFLYNALNTISALCDTNPDRARDVTDELALYLRSRFDFGNLEKLVPLKQELEYIYAYLNVERARFGERLRVEYSIEDGLSFLIPPLILQPLVENAVKHGLKTRRDGGLVRVSVNREGMNVVIRVSDNGMGMSDAKVSEVLDTNESDGVGLRNVHQRLKKLYGNGLSIASVLGQGTTVVVAIPWEAER